MLGSMILSHGMQLQFLKKMYVYTFVWNSLELNNSTGQLICGGGIDRDRSNGATYHSTILADLSIFWMISLNSIWLLCLEGGKTMSFQIETNSIMGLGSLWSS